MNKTERIKATLSGEQVDRPPVALWRHWPIDDQDAKLLAERALDYQKRYDWDFIKIPPSSSYCVSDYGAKHEYKALPSGKWLLGERTHKERVIKKIEDWDAIEPVDITKGTYGRILQCLKIVIKKRNPDIPVIQTLFNPLAMVRYLAGDDVYLAHLRKAPEKLERAIKALTETCVNFVNASINEGADGIFLSTSAASYEVMSIEEYDRFCRPYDLEILNASAKGWFNMLHIHGQQPMFNELTDYPVQVLNWHDRSAGPGLTEASKLFKGALAGGIEQYNTMHFGTPKQVKDQIYDAVKQTNGRRLIVASGCTYPITVPECNIIAVRQAIDTL